MIGRWIQIGFLRGSPRPNRVEFKIRNRILVGNGRVYDTFTTQHVPFSKPFFEHAMSRELITSWEYLSLFAETDRGICRNCCCSLCRNLGTREQLTTSCFFNEVKKEREVLFVDVFNSR